MPHHGACREQAEEGLSKLHHARACNFHARTSWSEMIAPMGSPEFALLDLSGKTLYRWFGIVERSEFDDSDCNGLVRGKSSEWRIENSEQ